MPTDLPGLPAIAINRPIRSLLRNPCMNLPAQATPEPDKRPACMVTLELLPPYSEEDVKQAYLEKVKAAHPDRGGDAADFNVIQAAFEQAMQYVRFRKNRHDWIAAQMDDYIAVQNVVKKLIDRFDAQVDIEAIDWMTKSFGDFAQLTDRVVRIHIAGSEHADEAIDEMVREQWALRYLRILQLPECRVSDEAVLSLRVFTVLRHLDLSGTPITGRALQVAALLPSLTSAALENTKVGPIAKMKLAYRLRQHQKRRSAADAIALRARMVGE